MPSDLTLPPAVPIYRVWHVVDGAVDGAASIVARPPSFVWAKPGTLHVRRFRDALRGLGATQAAAHGRALQRGEYVLTEDFGLIQTIVRAAHPAEEQADHDESCASCLAGLDQARAHLREHPESPLVAGVLYFLGASGG